MQVPIAFSRANFPLDFLYIFEEGEISAVKLEASLRQVLAAYPPFAGRLMDKGAASENEDGLPVGRIALNNAGVPLKVVENVGGSARDVEGWEVGPQKGKYSVLPRMKDVAAGRGPLMTVQLTHFQNGGCVLGVVFNHLVADGWSVAMFMRDWSEVHNGRKIQPIKYQPPRELLRCFAPAEMEEFVKSADLQLMLSGWKARAMMWMKGIWIDRFLRRPAPRRSVLHFSDAQVRRIKARAEQQAGSWVSSNEALAAHLHPLFLEVFGVGAAEPLPKGWATGALLPINLRGKVSGCCERTVGNLVTVAPVQWDLRAEAGPAREVHEAMRAALAEPSLLQHVKSLNYQGSRLEYYQHAVLSQWPAAGGVITQWNYQAVNPYYEVDFGAGPPTRSVPWTGEPVKVMRGLPKEGGFDVFVSHIDQGIKSWATMPWGKKARERYIEAKFIALENHPRLYGDDEFALMPGCPSVCKAAA